MTLNSLLVSSHGVLRDIGKNRLITRPYPDFVQQRKSAKIGKKKIKTLATPKLKDAAPSLFGYV